MPKGCLRWKLSPSASTSNVPIVPDGSGFSTVVGKTPAPSELEDVVTAEAEMVTIVLMGME